MPRYRVGYNCGVFDHAGFLQILKIKQGKKLYGKALSGNNQEERYMEDGGLKMVVKKSGSPCGWLRRK